MKKNSFVLTLFAFAAFIFLAASIYGEETAAPVADQGVKIRVAMYDGDGVGPSGRKNFPLVFAADPRFEMTKIDGKQVRDGILDNFDIFLMPGGMAGEEAASLKPEGVKILKEFIKSGKCYIGFCAGAYFPIEQRFMDNAQLKTRNWERGGADLKIESTDLGV
ncbi:MAG: DJ-1/PfpI family protein, partial [Thermoguttaceae bacterium]|nr:DJ-1/PfpI family protein [Thermoguttaceae bacterium]